MAKLQFLGRFQDGGSYATDGEGVYQLVPGEAGRQRAVPVEPERAERIANEMRAQMGSPAVPTDDGSFIGDMGSLAMRGGAGLVESIGRVGESVGFPGAESVTELGERGVEYWDEGLSQRAREGMAKRFVSEDGGIGEGLTDPYKVGGTIAESLLPMGLGIAGGAGAARVMMAGGKVSPGVAGIAGGALGEGSIAGVMSAGQMSKVIDDIPEAKMVQAEPYQRAYHKLAGLPETERRAQAREIVRNKAMADVGTATAVLTAFFGAPSGYAIGKMVGGEVGKSMLRTMAKQGFLEGVVQEVPQSVGEQYVSNVTAGQYDPDIKPTDDLAEAGVGGLVAGTAMGAGLAPAVHIAGQDAPERGVPGETEPAFVEPEPEIDETPPEATETPLLPGPQIEVDAEGVAATPAQREAEAARRADLGLTPDVEEAQARTSRRGEDIEDAEFYEVPKLRSIQMPDSERIILEPEEPLTAEETRRVRNLGNFMFTQPTEQFPHGRYIFPKSKKDDIDRALAGLIRQESPQTPTDADVPRETKQGFSPELKERLDKSVEDWQNLAAGQSVEAEEKTWELPKLDLSDLPHPTAGRADPKKDSLLAALAKAAPLNAEAAAEANLDAGGGKRTRVEIPEGHGKKGLSITKTNGVDLETAFERLRDLGYYDEGQDKNDLMADIADELLSPEPRKYSKQADLDQIMGDPFEQFANELSEEEFIELADMGDEGRAEFDDFLNRARTELGDDAIDDILESNAKQYEDDDEAYADAVRDELENRLEARRQEETGEDAGGASVAEETEEEPILQSYDEEDLKAKEARASDKELEKKAQIDNEVDGFRLEGEREPTPEQEDTTGSLFDQTDQGSMRVSGLPDRELKRVAISQGIPTSGRTPEELREAISNGVRIREYLSQFENEQQVRDDLGIASQQYRDLKDWLETVLPRSMKVGAPHMAADYGVTWANRYQGLNIERVDVTPENAPVTDEGYTTSRGLPGRIGAGFMLESNRVGPEREPLQTPGSRQKYTDLRGWQKAFFGMAGWKDKDKGRESAIEHYRMLLDNRWLLDEEQNRDVVETQLELIEDVLLPEIAQPESKESQQVIQAIERRLDEMDGGKAGAGDAEQELPDDQGGPDETGDAGEAGEAASGEGVERDELQIPKANTSRPEKEIEDLRVIDELMAEQTEPFRDRLSEIDAALNSGELDEQAKAAFEAERESLSEELQSIQDDIDDVAKDDYFGTGPFDDDGRDVLPQYDDAGSWIDVAPIREEDAFPPPKKIVNYDTKTQRPDEITPETAQVIRDGWKEAAREAGRTQDNSNKVVFSLFDFSGEWSKPWEEAGYQVIRYDIKNGDDLVRFFPRYDILDAHAKGYEIEGVLAAPCCRSFSAAGSQHWPTQHDIQDKNRVEEKYGTWAATYFDSPLEYANTLVAAVRQFVNIANPRWYAMENPIGRMRDIHGLTPSLVFHPHHFGDPYTKKTQIFGEFNPELPPANVYPSEGSRIHNLSSKQKAEREKTPEGFAYSFFMANHQGAEKTEKKPRNKWNPHIKNITRKDLGQTIHDTIRTNLKTSEDHANPMRIVSLLPTSMDKPPSLIKMTDERAEKLTAVLAEAFKWAAKEQGWKVFDEPLSMEQLALVELPDGRRMAIDKSGYFAAESEGKERGYLWKTDAEADQESAARTGNYEKIQIEEQVEVEDSGETVTITRAAPEVVAEIDRRIDAMKLLVGCLKS